MLTSPTHGRTSFRALSALMTPAIIACASGGASQEDDLAGRGILIKKRYAASVARVDLGAMAAAYSAGDSARGQFHGAVYRGLIRSIGSRSGRTLDSAMVVITLHEEYALLRARGLEPTAVAHLHCGRTLCDQMEVIDRKSRVMSTLYFDVSIPQAWGEKHLRQ
jgi:hypothetical protein